MYTKLESLAEERVPARGIQIVWIETLSWTYHGTTKLERRVVTFFYGERAEFFFLVLSFSVFLIDDV